jgi:surface protein
MTKISKWNIRNCIDISEIFSGCSNLNTFPNISKWKTDNIINMGKIFYKCKRLSLLKENIKLQWDTRNVTNME